MRLGKPPRRKAERRYKETVERLAKSRMDQCSAIDSINFDFFHASLCYFLRTLKDLY